MKDTETGDWMRALPRTNASPAFTREVLRKAHQPAAAWPLVWRIAAAVAMAACLVAAVQLGIAQQRRHAETLALRAEQQKIEAELEAVKKIAHESEPVVVLENDRGTRVIVDLDSAAQNASLRHYD